MKEISKVSVKKLEEFMVEVFLGLDVPKEEAKICADVLITSDLHGIESHGVGRLKMYYDRIKAGIQSPITKIDIIKDRKAIAVWDGNHGMGHVISKRAMQNAIDKAKNYGMGSVAVRNSTHYGIAGYYAKLAAKQNMIGLTFTNARPSICPTFGTDPMLGTNPICFGAPSDLEYPFLYDAATSISQRGKVEVLDRENKDTPSGWAIDQKGNPYTDTKKLLVDLVDKKAAMTPLGGIGELMGGHKGYGLGTMVEILSAALQNGSYLHDLHGWENGKRVPYKLGHFFMAINIDFFTEIDEFKKITGDIMRQMQKSKRADLNQQIYVAGEKEFYNEKRIRKDGVPINKRLQENLLVMKDELNITSIDFDF